MSTIKYRQAYAQLGEEHVQQDSQGRAAADLGAFFTSEDELFWAVRRDYNWCKLPGVFK